MEYRSPLFWPAEYPTHATRNVATNFPAQLSISEALGLLDEEIRELKPDKIVFFSNYESIQVERLRKRLNTHPAVSIELTVRGHRFFLGCDAWQFPEHNIYGLYLTVRQFRLMEAFGVADLPRLMYGFSSAAVRPVPVVESHSAATDQDWRALLGLGPTATIDDAEAVYRRRVKATANDEAELTALNVAITEARKHFNRQGIDVTERRKYPPGSAPDGEEQRKKPWP